MNKKNTQCIDLFCHAKCYWRAKYNKPGFTLLETLIAISIVGIMATVGFGYLNSNKLTALVNTSQRELAAAVRLAQGYSLQGRMQNIGGEMRTPCGYGLRFTDGNHYEIFYNKLPGEFVECGDITSSDSDYFHFNNGTSVVIEKYSLDKKISLIGYTNYSKTEIYFVVPHGKIYDGNGDLLSDNKEYTIGGGSYTKEVTLNSHGLVLEN